MATYFDKKRAFASGIASCGAGFGTFIFAPIIHVLDDNFGWSLTLMMIGAVVLFCIPLALLFKPIKDNKSNRSSESWEGTEPSDDFSCFGCISISDTKMGKGHFDLLLDVKFILFVLSNLLTNIGFGVPYAYTVASTMKRTLVLNSGDFFLLKYCDSFV